MFLLGPSLPGIVTAAVVELRLASIEGNGGSDLAAHIHCCTSLSLIEVKDDCRGTDAIMLALSQNDFIPLKTVLISNAVHFPF